MATHNSNISKHKAKTTRLTTGSAAQAGTQAFDIIPRSKVRPSTNSRPVITDNQPLVADTTLKAPSSAPVLDVKHSGIDLEPPKTAASAAAEPVQADNKPAEQGVPVADLMAKRQASQAEQPPAGPAPEQVAAGAEPQDTPTESQAEPAQPAPETADVHDDASLEAALNAGTDKPQEHSEALKDAIKDLGNTDLRHHELYEGKPVIVVHGNHGRHPVLSWVLWFMVSVLIALLVVNFLLDAELITTDYSLPYTDLL